MSLNDLKQAYKADIKAVFRSGYTVKTQEEALENLSETFANSLEGYVNERISEFNAAQGIEDTFLRTKVKALIDEINKIKVVQGNNVNTLITNQIKDSI